ncbi:unnamed protein product [Ectocarpus fasciculatus]
MFPKTHHTILGVLAQAWLWNNRALKIGQRGVEVCDFSLPLTVHSRCTAVLDRIQQLVYHSSSSLLAVSTRFLTVQRRQQWRDFLSGNKNHQPSPMTRSEKRRKRTKSETTMRTLNSQSTKSDKFTGGRATGHHPRRSTGQRTHARYPGCMHPIKHTRRN